MRKLMLGGLAVVGAAVWCLGSIHFFSVWADEKKEAEKCPISGKPAKEECFLNVNGKKVHFCCDKCPKAYEKKIGLKDEGPKTCPISGKPAKEDEKLIHLEAKRVAFCCDKCPKGFAKKNGFEFTDKGAKKCAACEEDAKADQKLVVNGESTYFCCEKCKKAYVKKLGVDDKAPTACPVSGKPIKEETEMIFVTSKAVYFCCDKCPEAYAKKNFKKE